MHLETRLNEDGFLPPTLYIQIDGGPDLANKSFYAMMTLLVARQVGGIKKIVVTRLPVGHTHEVIIIVSLVFNYFITKDCDAKFGNLWRATLRRPILTPQEYEKLVRSVFKKKKDARIEVIDIFICPDYIHLMWDCIDHEIKRIWKKEQTQHQWIFTSVERDINHRFRVHTEYRAFDQPYVFNIIDIDPSVTPQYTTDFRVEYAEVPTQPTHDNKDEFICFLSKFPTRSIKPVGIYKDSTFLFQKTLDEINKYFTTRKNNNVLKEWSEFSQSMPKTDNVRDYLDEIKINSYVPLKQELFGNSIDHDLTSEIKPTTSKVKTAHQGPIDFERFDGEPIPRVRYTARASHSGYDKSNIPTKEVLYDPASAKSPEEAYQMLVNKIMNFTEDSCTAEGFIVYLNKANIPYKKSWRKRQLLDA